VAQDSWGGGGQQLVEVEPGPAWNQNRMTGSYFILGMGCLFLGRAHSSSLAVQKAGKPRLITTVQKEVITMNDLVQPQDC